MEILRENAQLISAIASVGGFFIWTVYAFLFYGEYRRHRGSHIFIHAAGDGGPDTECLIINLSPEPIHILCSLATFGEHTVQLKSTTEDDLPLKARAKQGPLEVGEYLSLGQFKEISALLYEAGAGDDAGDSDEKENTHALEMSVAAIHGLSDNPIGASRVFIFDADTFDVVPETSSTQQLRSKRDSRQVTAWINKCRGHRMSRVWDKRNG